MPLLDHFRPPLSERRHWAAFHVRWASAIADALNRGLPAHLFAEPTATIAGQMQVDVATLDERATSANGVETIATLPATAPPPTWSIPAVFADAFEVKLINTEGGPRLVAAIELISPSNKDRPQTRRAFASKCASYLSQGVACIIVDIVTSRSANLHNEIVALLLAEGCRLPDNDRLYAAAYRPIRRDARDEIDIWPARFGIGDPLPSLPLWLGGESHLLVDFEATYQETCQRLRLSA